MGALNTAMSVWDEAVQIDGDELKVFGETVEREAAAHARLFVYFTGAKNADGQSWCPDCNDVVSTLRKVINEQKDLGLVIVNVKRENYKGIDDYFLRRHKGVRLSTVPTFGRWVNGRLEMKLEETQVADVELLEEVF